MNDIINDLNYFHFPALSASGINAYYQHPAIFWATSPLNPAYEPSEKTPAMIFGTLLHAKLLEGEEKVDELFLVNDLNRNTNDFKDIKKANPDKFLIKTEDVKKADGIIKTLRNDEDARMLLETCRYEEPFTWEKDGLTFKMKIDAFKTKGHLIVDYKSTEDTTEDELNRTIINRGYHRAAALYMDGYEIKHGVRPLGFVDLFQNKSYPEIIIPMNINPEQIELGAFENECAIRDIKRRLAIKYWKTSKGVIDSKTSDWYKAKGVDLDDKWSELMRQIEEEKNVGN